MKTPHTRIRRAVFFTALIAFLLAPALNVNAKGKGFKDIVKHIESNYRVKKTHIPMLGLANFAIKLVRPAGVKGFKLAVFEDQDFSNRPEIASSFTAVMREAYSKDWMPLVQINSKREGNTRTFIYARYSGKDAEFAVVSFQEREAVVMEAKFNPDAAARFLENPKLMGISLGNSVRGKGNGQVNGGGVDTAKSDAVDDVNANRTSGPTSDSTLSTANVDTGNRSRPSLPGGSDSEIDPNKNEAAQALSGVNLSGVNSSVISPAATETPSDNAIRIETRLVNLNVKAMNRAGQPLTNLKPEEFSVYEDGVKQAVAYFKPVDAPVNMVLLLDLSGSTRKKRKAMIGAANGFIDALPARDRVSLVAFTRKYRALTDFTSDKDKLKEAIKKINSIDGGTAFYDSMWKALDELGQIPEARKSIVVLTDGEDESLIGDKATAHTFSQLLDRASEQDVTIYPIYFKQSESLAKLGVMFGSGGLGESEDVKTARKQLDELAEMTGGEMVNAQQEGDLSGAYARVAAELHTLYSLAYSPDKLKHNGEFRKISVKINRDGGIARTRRGYYDK